MDLWIEIGQRIRRVRERRRLSQGQLAKRLGLSRTSVVNLEQGRQRVPLDRIYDAARYMGVPVTRLLPKEA